VVQNGYVDDVPVEKVKEFQAKMTEFLTTRKPELLAKIVKEKALNDALTAELKTASEEFKQTWVATNPPPKEKPKMEQPAR